MTITSTILGLLAAALFAAASAIRDLLGAAA